MTHGVLGWCNGGGVAITRALLLVGSCALPAGCGSGDDTVSPPAPAVGDAGSSTDATAAPLAEAGKRDGGASEAGSAAEAGVASATFSQEPIDFGNVNCGASESKAFAISNVGSAVLTVSASTVGSAFSVSPSTLSVPKGGAGMLTINVTIPALATAGASLVGAFTLFTTDSTHSNVPIALSATPEGATIVDPATGTAPTVDFPSSEVNTPTPAQTLTLKNIGNSPATVTFGTPSDPQFSLASSGTLSLAAGAGSSVTAAFDFTPAGTASSTANSAVTVSGVTCGTSVTSVSMAGHGAVGDVTGYPSRIDFGLVACGGGVPVPQEITLTNQGVVDAHVTTASVNGPAGFTTSAAVGQSIGANGGTLLVAFTAPAVPNVSPLTLIAATVSLQTDADPSPQVITLSESPEGAVLAFDTSPTSNFGSFGQAVLLQAVTQSFNVTNLGNAPANVTLVAAASPGFDAGAEAPATFGVASSSFPLAAGGSQNDSATYAATAVQSQTGTLSMTATGALCAPLPAPLSLSGSGIGGGLLVAPTSLEFAATCGGDPPGSQTLMVNNVGGADLTWVLGIATGPGAAFYGVSSTPPPGRIHPGDSASITVTAAAVPSPAGNADPASYAAQITLTTDIPFDGPHAIALGETPLGDQLSFSTDLLRFGQFPVNTTTLAQTLTVTNNANVGSLAANVSLLTAGVGASAYSVTPASIANLAVGGAVSTPIAVTFDPAAAVTYSATLAMVTTDSLCAPLPSPTGLFGTGTQGQVSAPPSSNSPPTSTRAY